MSGKNVTPTNKDGTPDRRTTEGREAVASGKAPSASEAPAASSSAATGDNYHPTEHRDKDGVPLTKDGHPDRRTVEGREAADNGQESNKDNNKDDVPRNKDGTPDRRTTEGREAADKENKTESKDHGHNTRSSSKHHEEEFEEGDHVVFNIGSNNLHGTISKVITEDVEVDGRIAHGTKDEPRYAVKYDDTGVEQIRTAHALQKDEGQATNDAGGKYSERTGGGAAASTSKTDNDASGTYRPTEHVSKDGVPLTKDGHPDRRTVEGREAAESEQKDNSSSKKKKDHKSHDFKEGQTVVFRVGKHEIHGKIHNVKGVSEQDAKTKKDSDDKHIASKKESKDKGEKEPEHKFNEGDAVTFNIGLNELHGKITKVITGDDIVDGRVAHGTKDEPRYAVEYEGTGKEQIRTESALKEADDDKMSEDKSNNKRKREDDKDSKDSSKDKATSSPSPKKTKSK